jgi:trk system potassium uptake protein TrkA
MNRKRRSFVVIGLGSFGSTVASELARLGGHVLGIGLDERNVSALADTLSEAIIADGRDEEALREAGVGKYDVAVVAIGEDLEANILTTMNVKRLGVPVIWAKATSRDHKLILGKLGVDRVIQPELEIGQHIAQMLHDPQLDDYVSLDHGNFIVYYKVPEQLEGKTLDSLGLLEKFNIRCLGVMRGADYHACSTGDLALLVHDKLILLGSRRHLTAFGESL